MKKFLALLMAAMMCLMLCACSSSGDKDDSKKDDDSSVVGSESKDDETNEEEKKEDNKPIDFTVDGGTIKYVGVEKANEGLTDEENVIVVKFAFTSNMDTPAQCQQAFGIKFYQNGVQLDKSLSWSSKGGDQYDLVGDYFSEVMKGGTVTFGRLVQVDDYSPLTIMVNEKLKNDSYQMMELDLGVLNGEAASDDAPAGEDAPATEPAETPSEPTESTSAKIWSMNYYVDDFDEPTDEWYIMNNTPFAGTFSNSATTDSSLTATILVDFENEVTFFLYEYGRNQVKNSSERYVDEYDITMRTADGADHNITGTLYCGGDRIFIDDKYIDEVITALKSGEKVMFRIVNSERTVESYLLKINTGNFAEVYDAKVQGE